MYDRRIPVGCLITSTASHATIIITNKQKTRHATIKNITKNNVKSEWEKKNPQHEHLIRFYANETINEMKRKYDWSDFQKTSSSIVDWYLHSIHVFNCLINVTLTFPRWFRIRRIQSCSFIYVWLWSIAKKHSNQIRFIGNIFRDVLNLSSQSWQIK